MVTLSVDIPEELYQKLTGYVLRHPRRNVNDVGTAAIALFLMQEGCSDRGVNQIYLDAIFGSDRAA